jgi:hypothetical protein
MMAEVWEILTPAGLGRRYSQAAQGSRILLPFGVSQAIGPGRFDIVDAKIHAVADDKEGWFLFRPNETAAAVREVMLSLEGIPTGAYGKLLCPIV